MPSLNEGVAIMSDVVFDAVRSRESRDSVMESDCVCIERVSRDLRDSVGELSSITGDSFVESALDLAFPFDFSGLSDLDERLNIALKVGAAGFSLGVADFDDCGRVPITPTGGGDDCGRNSSSSVAIPVLSADVEPCCIEGRREGLRDHGPWSTFKDQLVANGLFLLATPPSAAAGQPKGALSVEGRGKSEEAIDAGLGLLGSLSEYTDVWLSILELNILNPRRLVVMLRAGAGPFPSLTSPPGTLRFRKGKPPHPVEKLVRRFLTPSGSVSSVCLGKEWLCPGFNVPRAGPSSFMVFPRCLKLKRSPKRLAGASWALE